MNEQQLQQILTIQQAIAAAATAAVINSLLNPQQAGANANALNDSTAANNDLQQQLQQHHHQQQIDSRQQSPATSSSPATQIDSNARIQELLLQLQQQAVTGSNGGPSMPLNAAAAALNLNLNQNQLVSQTNLVGGNGGAGSPISSRSPVSNRLMNQQQTGFNAAATSSGNTHQSNQVPPNKKLKRHQQQFPSQQPNRPPIEATSKPQHSTPKNHSAISSLNSRSNSNNSTNSSSSSTFISNNVGLPRKLVRGQDVWLGRGAEQTRQILKCMWCGQSFRTLAEMTQHMKVTQHYTNIISQEQITSWRQPESSEASSNKINPKQSAQFRSLDDNNDDLSDKFNDSDREDSNISNEDVNQPIKNQRNNRSTTDLRTSIRREFSTPATDSSSTTGSSRDETSPNRTPKGSSQQATAKPLTRSRRRENDDVKPASTIKITSTETSGRENSSVSSSSQLRQNNNTSAVLSDLNEDSKANKKSKIEEEEIEVRESDKTDDTEQDDADKELENSIKSFVENELLAKQEERELKEKILNSSIVEENEDTKIDKAIDNDLATDYSTSEKDSKDRKLNDSSISADGNHENIVNGGDDDDDADDDDEADDDVEIRYRSNDDNEDEDKEASDSKDSVSDKISKKLPKVRESIAIQATEATKSNTASQLGGGDPDDPLSALETMVEKSFDPRLRPGVANGGILQRLGIDEEVCPPWQHINYANWYAAAAYGHPMAAALLAAGINLQNGIKLSKNVTPKKSDE